MLVGTLMKYILHTIDLQNENPWENKVVYMLYADVVLGEWVSMATGSFSDTVTMATGFLKVSLYFAFMSFMLHVHMFPLYIMRRTYLAVKYVSIYYEKYSSSTIAILYCVQVIQEECVRCYTIQESYSKP